MESGNVSELFDKIKNAEDPGISAMEIELQALILDFEDPDLLDGKKELFSCLENIRIQNNRTPNQNPDML